jgi:hypothetical protein
MVQIPLAHNIVPPDLNAQSALTLAILAAPVDPKVINPSDLLGLDPKSPRIGSNAKLYLLRQVFSQPRKKLSLK